MESQLISLVLLKEQQGIYYDTSLNGMWY